MGNPQISDDVEPTIDNGVDVTMSRRVLRKIDFRLIPLIFITCNFFMDKSILSSAAVFQLRDDNHLKGQEYSWVSSVFYFGYLLWMYPTTLLCSRLPIARYLTVNTLIWGILVGVTAACTSYGGLVTIASVIVNATNRVDSITSTWYTRDEIPIRTGIWFTGNSIGGIISNLFAYGVGHIDDNIHPWRWMYIILGILTFLWAFGIWAVLPNSISDAKFLTEEERQFARDRVIIAGTGQTEKTVFRWDQFTECLIDPKTWLLFAITLCAQIPNGGTQNFGNLVIKSFGFSSLDSTLIDPTGSNCRPHHCWDGVSSGQVQKASLSADHRRGVQLFGYMLLSTGPAPVPLVMSMIQANFKGVTKKMTMTAILFFAYCAGNIAGPQLFKSSEAPTYDSAFRAIMICYSLVVGLCLALRVYLQWINARRQREEGIQGSAATSGAVAGGKMVDIDETNNIAGVVQGVALQDEDYDDVTDWKTVGFRYRY